MRSEAKRESSKSARKSVGVASFAQQTEPVTQEPPVESVDESDESSNESDASR